jgi:hypothetical protein
VEETSRRKPTSVDPYAEWDNGEPLTVEERAALMKLSTYQHSREMNIRLRRHMEAGLKNQFKSLINDTKAVATKPARPAITTPVSNEPPRRSARTNIPR